MWSALCFIFNDSHVFRIPGKIQSQTIQYSNPMTSLRGSTRRHIAELFMHVSRALCQQLLHFLHLSSDLVFFTNHLHMLFYVDLLYIALVGIAFCKVL